VGFAFCEQDLRTGRGMIVSAEGNTIKTNGTLYFVEPGMTVVNEQGRVLTRVTSTKELSLEVERPITAADLPDADKDGVGRFILMALGPGDEAQVGSVVIGGAE